MWKSPLLLLFAGLILVLSATGCGESSSGTAAISPEEAKKIVGEDPDYLPGLPTKKGKAQ